MIRLLPPITEPAVIYRVDHGNPVPSAEVVAALAAAILSAVERRRERAGNGWLADQQNGNGTAAKQAHGTAGAAEGRDDETL